MVTYDVLLLVFLPAVPRRFRRAVEVGVLALVVLIGLSRIGLGVHYPSDVVAGWALGALWLAVTAVAFRRWNPDQPSDRSVTDADLRPDRTTRLRLAPAQDTLLPDHGRTAAEIGVGFVALWGALLGLGLLVTGVLRDQIRPVDTQVAEWLVGLRSEPLSTVAVAVGGSDRRGASSSPSSSRCRWPWPTSWRASPTRACGSRSYGRRCALIGAHPAGHGTKRIPPASRPSADAEGCGPRQAWPDAARGAHRRTGRRGHGRRRDSAPRTGPTWG